MLMGRNLHFFRLNIKSKLLNSVGIFLLCLKFDNACNFVIILYFYFFDDAFWTFRRHKSSEIEHSFINIEDIRFNHILNT